VRFTANFEANLAQISFYWTEQGAPQAYLHLLDEIGDTVIGNLERHPRIGRRFFARAAQSVEVRERVAALRKRFGEVEVREYLSGDCVLLYCVSGATTSGSKIHLLAIRHHLQLSFDFEGFWRDRRDNHE
jgi:hypothetical protein